MKQVLLLSCVFLLSSCGGLTAGLPSQQFERPQGRSHVASVTFADLFSFKGSNGAEPAAVLIDSNGTLYGTTYAGGMHDDGTVFAFKPNGSGSGSHTVLFSFKGGSDGALPLAGVLDVKGTLYGTTTDGGGPGGEGVVFKLSSSGSERVLHRFGVPGDGANPYAPLIDLAGTLIGTSAGGGTQSDGTVFTISRSGKEAILHSFNLSKGEGSTPVAPLLDVDGTLYGTTAYGGTNCGSVGCGTVFKMSASGSQTVLYSFKGGTAGTTPSAPLVNVDGTLYGTTAYGGEFNDGTVFKITPSGNESLIYSFQGGNDGAVPQSLAVLSGTLYGTTTSGGAKNFGTVFSMTTEGTESVLHTFKGGSDGASPRAGLVAYNGTLYGTTASGGRNDDGTLFSLTP
jgi:uncharacterized repeat protein (TIGR03803 family)